MAHLLNRYEKLHYSQVRTWRPEGAHLYEAQPTWIYDEPSGKWVAELRHRIVPDSGNYDDPYAELGTRRARRIIESPYAYGGRGTSPGRVDTAYMHHLYKREPYQKHHTMIADDKEHNNYYSYHDDADDDIHWRTDLDFREALSGRAGDDPLAMVPGLQLGGLSGFNFNAMDRTTSVGSTPNDGRRATSAVDKESLLKQYMKTYYDDDRVSESPSTMTEARRQQRKARRQARKERIAQDGGRSRSYGRMDPNLRSVDYSQRKSAYKYNTETQKLKRMHQHDSRRHQHGMLSFAPA
ncbi:unnamed protein product [Amoebophrya sp. A120]|nr:unnamed protein product [Amoebophrya sp. A120]|eukprot:GSA120T00011412001.1